MGGAAETLRVGQTDVTLRRVGSGPELLFLHGHLGLWKLDPFIDALAKTFTVIVSSHPGFEDCPVDERLNSVDDLGYLYLDLLDALGAERLPIVGSSLGGWIALSAAIKNAGRLSSLVLIDPVGAHFGGPEDAGVGDIFSMSEDQFTALGFADPAQGKKPYATMTDAELLTSSRNREAAARYAWMPPLYDPKLAQRLHRVNVPTLVLWGEQDRITDRAYAEDMAARLPQATLQTIPGAGHFPVMEQPVETAARIAAFVG